MSDPKAFRTAVELDQYLLALTPKEQADLRKPSPFLDQVNAARDEGIAISEQILGHGRRWVPHAGIPEWVRLGILDTLLKWNNGEVITCIHQPTFDHPEPVLAAAWKPGVVVCGRCSPMLALPTGTPADRTCDGCGHLCEGMPDDGILPFVTWTANLGYQAGVCGPCHKDLLRVQREAGKP